jgi:histidinol-phosphate aminotransferase
MDIMSLTSPHIRGLEAYDPPDWEALAAGAGVSPDRLIRLDANENYYAPSPRVAEALARSESFRFYPDYGPLKEAIARYAGVGPEHIVLGNGGGGGCAGDL